MNGGVNYPNFVVTDVNDPIRSVFDSGGVPGEAMRVLLRVGTTMRGVYDIRSIGVDLHFANSFGDPAVFPTVRLYVARTPLP